MAIPAFWRVDEYVKAANGYAMANGQVFFCTQPSNTSAFPPSPLAQLYADPFGLTPISQPLIADGFGHVDAYVAAGTYTMVVALSNVIQNVYPDQSYGLSSAQIILETNGVPNSNQGVLNIVGAGDISVTLNALGQTVVESTGVVLPGTGNGPLIVTANAGFRTLPSGTVLVADGLGNAQGTTGMTPVVASQFIGGGDSALQASSFPFYSNGAYGGGIALLDGTHAWGMWDNSGTLQWGSGTGATGTLTPQMTLSSTGNLSVVSINGVLNAADFPGADIGLQVNAAISALGSNGGTVFIPSGVYAQSTTIVKPKNVSIIGGGAASTLLVWQLTTGVAMVFTSPSADAGIYEESQVADLSLVGSGAGNATTGVYFGGSDSSAGSPTLAQSAATNYGDHQNINRVRIGGNGTGFGTGVQWGNNAWSTTFHECLIDGNGVNVFFPGTPINSGERIVFIGCSVQNSIGIGVKIATYATLDMAFIGCSLDYNANGTNWTIQNGTSAGNQTVTIDVGHMETPGMYIQNFGVVTATGVEFANGTASGSAPGYLIDNEFAGMTLVGGFLHNGGTGTIFNAAGIGAICIGVTATSSLNNVLANIDRAAGNIAGAQLNTSGPIIIAGATPSGALTGLGLGITTSGSASTHPGGVALPALAFGYLEVNIGGTVYKIPFYSA